MATLPTPEENARNVLEVFRHLDRRAGEVVLEKTLLQTWAKWGWRIEDDLASGLLKAEELGWVERTKRGYRLTDEGFRDM